MHVFRIMVSSVELIVRKFPWAVQITAKFVQIYFFNCRQIPCFVSGKQSKQQFVDHADIAQKQNDKTAIYSSVYIFKGADFND